MADEEGRGASERRPVEFMLPLICWNTRRRNLITHCSRPLVGDTVHQSVIHVLFTFLDELRGHVLHCRSRGCPDSRNAKPHAPAPAEHNNHEAEDCRSQGGGFYSWLYEFRAQLAAPHAASM